MVMVHSSLPVSDIKIYSSDTHPPATQIHTNTHTLSSSRLFIPLAPTNVPLTPFFSLPILPHHYLASAHCHEATRARHQGLSGLCKWHKKLWKCLRMFTVHDRKRLRPRSPASASLKASQPQREKRDPLGVAKPPKPPLPP